MSNIFLETIRAVDGELYNVNFHQKRYESVLREFGVKDTKELSSYLTPPKKGIYRCRLTYDISKTKDSIHVAYSEYKKKDITSLKLIYNDTIEYRMKSTCRDEIDKLYALRAGCDDILIIKNNFVTDTSVANIAFFDSEKWVTPKSALLKGTTRQRLLEEGKIVQEDIHIDDLDRFSKVALMNAMIDFDIITKNAKEVLC